ncbi:hypothetical protein GCM10020219_024150 [Nonomuraea dietziae]
MAVSCSGRTAETLAVAAEAVRRGASLLAVGAQDSPLHAIATQASALFVPVEANGPSRANLWGMAVPLVAAAGALGLVQTDPDLFEGVAKGLEDMANRCPSLERVVRQPRQGAGDGAGRERAGVLGRHTADGGRGAPAGAPTVRERQVPAQWGALPEAGHNQLGVVEGPLAERDIFAESAGRTIRLVVLREPEERPISLLRVVEDRDVPVSELAAEGAHPLERLATLIELGDYASAYLALGYGIDPTPVTAITELKSRTSQ